MHHPTHHPPVATATPTLIPILPGPVPLSLPLAEVQLLLRFFLLPIEETSDAQWTEAQDLVDRILADRAAAVRQFVEAR